ncbi:uncharacterized protein LOC107981074 [Nasonia vitripennis]|uniref:Uncharacterized protein n=1 Tax=Nasonia vitripennis TaxID=7425 RepID=A0A7M7QB13_NASVI|nr:uncharacterized protein LOC107981074 [Nasonia vitripennis]
MIDFVNYTYFDEDTFDIAMNYQSESQNVVSMRIDIIQDLPQNIHLKCVLWGYASGQYNVPTGIEMDLDVCDNQFKDYFFNVILTKMNLDKECPAKKGTYENEGFDPEISGFPMYLPSGFRLLLQASIYSGNISLIKTKAYLVVV